MPKGTVLAGAVKPFAVEIEDQDDAPSVRNGQTRDYRRWGVIGATATVQDETALLEGADADARAATALEERCHLARRGGPTREPCQSGAQR